MIIIISTNMNIIAYVFPESFLFVGNILYGI